MDKWVRFFAFSLCCVTFDLDVTCVVPDDHVVIDNLKDERVR